MSFHHPFRHDPANDAREGFSGRHRSPVGVLLAGFACILARAALAMVTRSPWIFPSLGASSFLLFSAPDTDAASPRNVICGHAIAIICGYGALLATNLVAAPPSVVTGVDGARVLAAALSLGFCGAFMLLLRMSHAPAGATALIVSLGLITQPLPQRLLIVEGAVALLVAMAFVIHRIAGVPYPLWKHAPKVVAKERARPRRT